MQQIPLSETEEAVYQLLQRISVLEDENEKLKERIKELNWQIQEHD